MDRGAGSDEPDESNEAGPEPDDVDIVLIERAALNDSAEGRVIAAEFVADFGRFMTETVRPVLRQVAIDGGEPQLLVNGIAELLRLTAESIEFPIGTER